MIGLVAVVVGDLEGAGFEQCGLVLSAEAVEDVIGEVGRGGDADQGFDALGPGQGDEEGHPAAHGGADERDGAFRGDVVENVERVGEPGADGAVIEVSVRGAVAGIVETDVGLAACDALFFEICGF